MVDQQTQDLGPARRIVTGHREDGKVVHIKDDEFMPELLAGGRAAFKVRLLLHFCVYSRDRK